ncbi:hypothetical protein [Fodinibius sp. SL11]|uniref:hypothetical protein n=1 Tax=Fodinibius sp. SL11 TaxID=3425690 RepID=UPI003F885B22
MTKHDQDLPAILKTLFCGIVFFFVGTINTQAQFIDLRLDIDSEITAQTEQPLDFGTLMTNTGRRMIELGSINMGIFSITALENQMLLVTLDKPTELRHNNPAVDDVIPLELFSRYGYSTQNYENSNPLPDATSNIKVEPNPKPGPWNSIYIFIYGSVDIGDVQDGTYANEIVLNVEYI